VVVSSELKKRQALVRVVEFLLYGIFWYVYLNMESTVNSTVSCCEECTSYENENKIAHEVEQIRNNPTIRG
jgi:hypothetical protein